MTRIRAIYSIFPIPLHKTWDTPAYIRNFPYHGMISVNFPDHSIKIKWYGLYIILYHGMISTFYIPDHPRPFRAVIIIIAIIVIFLNYLRILIIIITKIIKSLLITLDIFLLNSIKSELINYLIVKHYTKKRSSSNSRIY